jgi:hypothetical protein
LMETTIWEEYGTESGNPKCANCMVSCGYEPSAVNDMFGSFRGFMSVVRASLFDKYVDHGARDLLNAPHASGLGHSSPSLVQIASETKQMEETRV